MGQPGVTICSEARANTSPLVGAYTPQCTSQGYYKAKQFHASTGYSWCVTLLWKDIVNTMKGPGEEEPDCTGRPKNMVICEPGSPGSPGEISSSPPPGTSGPPCFIARLNTADVPGAYMPQCVKDNIGAPGPVGSGLVGAPGSGLVGAPGSGPVGAPGSGPVGAPGSPGRPISSGTFKAKQCHASTGYCWCADTEGGTKIAGTEKASWEGEPNC